MSRKGGKERSREQKLKDQAEIAQHYLQGQTQYHIAHVLGLSQAQISLDLQAVRQAWLDSSLRDFNEQKAQELAKIAHLEEVAWSAWEKSSRGDPGDPRFMNVIQWCITMRCKLLGLDEVMKEDGKKVKIDKWGPIGPVERASRIAEIMHAAEQRMLEAKAAATGTPEPSRPSVDIPPDCEEIEVEGPPIHMCNGRTNGNGNGQSAGSGGGARSRAGVE